MPGPPRTTAPGLRPARTPARSPSRASHCCLRPHNITRRPPGGSPAIVELAPRPAHPRRARTRTCLTAGPPSPSITLGCWETAFEEALCQFVLRGPGETGHPDRCGPPPVTPGRADRDLGCQPPMLQQQAPTTDSDDT